MLTRPIILSVVLLISSVAVFAQRYGQRVDVSVNVGYATFSQSDLKNLQRAMLAAMPVPMRIISSFPGYVNYTVDAVFYDSTYYVGIYLGHTSTGGRMQYTDYSGSLTQDQLVKMDYRGLLAARRIASTNIGSVFLGTNLSSYVNKVELRSSQVVGSETTASNTHLRSLNIGVGIFVELYKRFDRFFLKAHGGYEAHLAMDLYYDGKNAPAFTWEDETYKAHGNGLRLSAGVGYSLYVRRPR